MVTVTSRLRHGERLKIVVKNNQNRPIENIYGILVTVLTPDLWQNIGSH